MTTMTRSRSSHLIHLPVEGPRRIAAGVLVLLGGLLLALTLTHNLFKVGPSFERLTDGFRPHLTSTAIATARADLQGLGAAGTELQTTMLPAMAQRLGMSPAELSAYLTATYPAVSQGMQALPGVVTSFDGVITTLDQNGPVFRSADAIPTSNLPATTVPWGFAATGVLLIGLGVLVWTKPRAGAWVAVGLGAVLIGTTFTLSLPQKASDADQLNANLKPVYTAAMVAQADEAMTTVSMMGAQLQSGLLPDLATRMHMTPAQLQQMMAMSFPATSKALADLPTALPRMQQMVGTFEGNLDEYGTLKPVELKPIVGVLLAVGAMTLFVGAVVLAWPRHRRVKVS